MPAEARVHRGKTSPLHVAQAARRTVGVPDGGGGGGWLAAGAEEAHTLHTLLAEAELHSRAAVAGALHIRHSRAEVEVRHSHQRVEARHSLRRRTGVHRTVAAGTDMPCW